MVDHDRLFKELLRTFFVEFLELFLPDVLAFVDVTSIEFIDKEIFADVVKGRKRVLDLIVKVRYRDSPACFLIHVENQATRKSDFTERMYAYHAALFLRMRLPVYPIAVLSFDSPRTPQASVFRVAFPNKTVLEFDFDVLQLNRMDWRDLDRKSVV